MFRLQQIKWWWLVVAGVVVSSVGLGTIRSYLSTAHAENGPPKRDALPLALSP